MKRILAVATLSLPLLACGQQPQNTFDVRPVLAAAHAESALRPTHDVDCGPVIQEVIDDAVALQETPAFKQLAATPEYQAVMDDSDALDNNNCDTDDATPACPTLRKQYDADEDKMMHTPQFQTVTATPEYKAMEGAISEAQALGCME